MQEEIADNFTPVGYFRSPNYSSQTPFPPNYGQFYGILGVNNEGKLAIDPDLNNFTMFDSALSCGPVLVYGDRVLDDNDIESNELLQWPKVSNVKVKPGELAHVANPNPRTAIGILRDGNVRIVYIEGRGERGAGVDCSQLAQICKALGMVKAINLDGGRSSQLVWRAPGSNEISIGSSHTDGYPVGSIISFCK
jgi:exopolysaccharide biosynthesis protein